MRIIKIGSGVIENEIICSNCFSTYAYFESDILKCGRKYYEKEAVQCPVCKNGHWVNALKEEIK